MFGDVYVFVNNVGICCDKMFMSMIEIDWDDVMCVYLCGYFCLLSVLVCVWCDVVKVGNLVDVWIVNMSLGVGL